MAGLMDLIKGMLPQAPVEQSPLQSMGNSSAGVGIDYISSLMDSNFENEGLKQALLASIGHETGGTFDYTQKQGNDGPARGLFQMEGGMLDAYNNYVDTNNLVDSAQTQVGFMKSILDSGKDYDIGAGNRSKLRAAIATNNPDTILKEFTDRVERPGIPHNERRIEYLNKIKELRSR